MRSQSTFKPLACVPATQSVIVSAAMVLLLLTGCADPARRAERIAHDGGLSPLIVQGTAFRHQAYEVSRAPAGLLYVFIDGDGLPWIDGGTRIAANPTPRKPLALELAAQTPRSVLYLGRPCYYSVNADAGCTPDLWTSARYSARVVDSLASALNRHVESHAFERLVLVGYSGGGTLAMLAAPRIPSTTAVITIGSNLDVEAWTRWHGYLPLSDSLDPGSQLPLAPSIQQRHLIGGRDANVPAGLNERLLMRVPREHVWLFPEFDHRCCWREQWPAILGRIEAELDLKR